MIIFGLHASGNTALMVGSSVFLFLSRLTKAGIVSLNLNLCDLSISNSRVSDVRTSDFLTVLRIVK